MENKTIYIKLFGGCQIRVGTVVINEQTHQSRKPWLLLEYLIYNHDRMISSSELIQVLWNDGELTNPVNALKTLVLRSRKLLEPLGLPPQSLLSQKRGTYGWCPETDFFLDTDEFQKLLRSSARSISMYSAAGLPGPCSGLPRFRLILGRPGFTGGVTSRRGVRSSSCLPILMSTAGVRS